MRIAILGMPGSGRSTQAKLLAARYRVPRISVSVLLHEAIDAKKLAEKTLQALLAGQPVTDDLALKLLDERLRARDIKRGFIVDDFPGNIPQAQALDTLLGMLGLGLQIAIHIKVENETLVRQITGRLQCEQCLAVYNRHTAPPQSRGKCNDCGGKVVATNDDTPKAVALRVEEYHGRAAPLFAYYKAQHKLRTVIAEGDAEEIQEKICSIVDLEIRPLEVKTLETAAQSYGDAVNTVIAGGQISRIDSEVPTKRKRKAKPAATKPASRAAATLVKKAAAKKPVAKKTTQKKPTGKATAKKATKKVGKTTVAKKAATKKAVTKKAAAKKTPAKKSAAKKPAKKK